MKTDTQLQQDVMAELKWEPSVHASQIGVEVKDGVVTLAGEVSSYLEKWGAERVVQRVIGVRALAIDMTVKLSQMGKRTDTDIAASARNVLSWTNSVPIDTVQVLVEDGWITLSGEVVWNYQRSDAADRVRLLPGVHGVSNQISIKPRASAIVVKSEIEDAIKRRATSDTKTIVVDVTGGDVTLTGTVRSWMERDLVVHSAWGSPGVRQVFDRMTII
ncbi:BON domain protein [Delftia acidovorans]|uniref:BON domain-containing protein n=1 Tax=Delftia acidovorans TaxID=80866 RepID=UPI00050648B7|nr:BON domain-containing protein [Delftia acidovorans]KFJ09125.1 BON domain protein [Delftia acidovorans]QQB52781.1 BON domain-containing protein [Delftia acidovorans]